MGILFEGKNWKENVKKRRGTEKPCFFYEKYVIVSSAAWIILRERYKLLSRIFLQTIMRRVTHKLLHVEDNHTVGRKDGAVIFPQTFIYNGVAKTMSYGSLNVGKDKQSFNMGLSC